MAEVEVILSSKQSSPLSKKFDKFPSIQLMTAYLAFVMPLRVEQPSNDEHV